MSEEISGSEPCPCGRGETYGACCKPRGIRWEREGDELRSSYQVQLPEELRVGLIGASQKFERLFGRKPSGDDAIFYDAPIYGDDDFFAGMEILRSAGASEAELYAYYRTGGIFPTEDNEKFIRQPDLDEFARYCDEYEELMGADPSIGEMNALKHVTSVNDVLEDVFVVVSSDLRSALNYYIQGCSLAVGSLSLEPASLREYAAFISIKVVRTLDSLIKLAPLREASLMYAMSRSLFESYVILKAINDDSTFFEEKIRPAGLDDGYGLEVIDGQINYSKMHFEDCASRRPASFNMRDLNRSCGPKCDEQLYDLFFRPACRFIHVDALTARSYFYQPDLYTEFAPHLVAGVMSLALVTLVLSELAKLPFVDDKVQGDCGAAARMLSGQLLEAFRLLVVDEEQVEEEYRLFLDRLALIV